MKAAYYETWLNQRAAQLDVDGIIVLMDARHVPHNVWTFTRGFPVKFNGPQLKGSASEVAIELLEIAHEGLWQLSLLKLGAGLVGLEV